MAKMRKLLVFGAALCLMIAARIAPASAQQVDRSQLPIPDRQYKYPGKVPLDARDATFPPIKLLRPPEDAPNVVVILLDDIGFGAPSTFGGGVNIPRWMRSRRRACGTRNFTRPLYAHRHVKRF
jgi:arylsulfatase